MAALNLADWAVGHVAVMWEMTQLTSNALLVFAVVFLHQPAHQLYCDPAVSAFPPQPLAELRSTNTVKTVTNRNRSRYMASKCNIFIQKCRICYLLASRDRVNLTYSYGFGAKNGLKVWQVSVGCWSIQFMHRNGCCIDRKWHFAYKGWNERVRGEAAAKTKMIINGTVGARPVLFSRLDVCVEWRHSLLTGLDKVQGPQGYRALSDCSKNKSKWMLHTEFLLDTTSN